MASWAVSCAAFGTWVLMWGHELKLAVTDDEHCWLWNSQGPFISVAGDMHLPHTGFSISWKLSVFLCNIPIFFATQVFSLPHEQCLVTFSAFRKWPSSCLCFKITAQKQFVTIRVRVWRHFGMWISQQWSLGRWAAGLKCYPIHLPKKMNIWQCVTTDLSLEGNDNPHLANPWK